MTNRVTKGRAIEALAYLNALASAKGRTPSDSSMYEDIQQFINQSQSVSEWQPIETAPKDGTWILLAAPSGYGTTPYRVGVGRYIEEYRPLTPWQNHADDSFTDDGEPPTHWAPLNTPDTNND